MRDHRPDRHGDHGEDPGEGDQRDETHLNSLTRTIVELRRLGHIFLVQTKGLRKGPVGVRRWASFGLQRIAGKNVKKRGRRSLIEIYHACQEAELHEEIFRSIACAIFSPPPEDGSIGLA